MLPFPYIGITGITTLEQAEALAAASGRIGLPTATGHRLMAGYLVSNGSLEGRPRPPRYPALDLLPQLLGRTQGSALNMLHYRTDERQGMADQVSRLFEGLYETGLCRALQLNVIWPIKEEVAEIARRLPELEIVLCLTKRGLKKSPRQTLANLAHYKRFGPCFRRVLIDPSGGRGAAYEIDQLMPFYDGIRELLPDVAIGFAGGLRADNVEERLRELIGATGTTAVSIDAEGGLRVPLGPRRGDDVLEIDRAVSYLETAVAVLARLETLPGAGSSSPSAIVPSTRREAMRVIKRPGVLVLIPRGPTAKAELADWSEALEGHVMKVKVEPNGTVVLTDAGPVEDSCASRSGSAPVRPIPGVE